MDSQTTFHSVGIDRGLSQLESEIPRGDPSDWTLSDIPLRVGTLIRGRVRPSPSSSEFGVEQVHFRVNSRIA